MDATPSSQTNVFVTGAAGAVGQAVVRQLVAAGYIVTGSVSSSDEARVIRGYNAFPSYPDLLREGEMKSAFQAAHATIVVHAAPQLPNHAPQHDGRWEDYEPLLHEGTPALMRAAAAAGVQFVVFVGYAFAYNAAHGHDVATETSALGVDLPIIRAAASAEQAVLHGEVPGCVLRAGFVYGAHSPETVGLRDSLKAGRPIALGDDHASANWVQVEDLARAIVLCVQKQPAGEVFNVVDNSPATPTAFMRYFAESMNLPAPGKTPGFLSRMVKGKTQAALLDRSVRASNAKARESLGWTPQYPSYREGIDHALLILRAEEPVV